MKFTIFKKYIFTYIAVTIIGFVAVSAISWKFTYNKVLDDYESDLYHEAMSISTEYASDYFSSERMKYIEKQLQTLSELGSNRIMFITTDGNIILDTERAQEMQSKTILYTIDNFDASAFGTKPYRIDNLFGICDTLQLSAYAPINNSFTMKGYVIVFIPVSVISQKAYDIFKVNYITLIIICALNLLFILLYVKNVHIPIKSIIEAINEYGRGNLSYKTKVYNNSDEIGRLAISLNFMAEKLNESDKFQQKFLSNISHDFRSPLTSMKGYLEAISDGTIPSELTPKYINILLFETERLTKLTSNILTLNELDPKTVRLDISVFDINSIIKHTIETFEGRCKKKHIQFQLTFSNEKEMVKADAGKIGQVIYNLIDNAIKFSFDNSYIFITVKEKGEKAYISVKDTGSGISKENISKIWDRFYKSDASRGRDKKGSGLGLSITKEIIKAHNENIDVISTPNVGTEFIFSVPLDKANSSRLITLSNLNDEDALHNS